MTTATTWTSFTADVARTDNAPKVVFPFGVKIVEYRGEKMLCPLTADEYARMCGEHGIKPLSEEEALRGCSMQDGCQGKCGHDGRCEYRGGGAGILCFCVE